MLAKLRLVVKLLVSVCLITASCWATTTHITSSDSATVAYGKMEAALCGDTVIYDTQPQRTLAAGTLFRVHLTQSCSGGSPLVIQAQDTSNQPLFDFSGFPIDINHRLGTLNAAGSTLTWVSCADSPSSICNINPFYPIYVGHHITVNGTSCVVASYVDGTHITYSGCSLGTLTGATYDIVLDETNGHCGLIPGSYHVDDCSRSAWFIDTTQYVTLDGFHVKGGTSTVDENTAAFRVINGNHNTMRDLIAELSYAGFYAAGLNDTFEYDQAINNGFYGNEQSHNMYATGGDNITVRYSYFYAAGCCIRSDGTVSPGTGGQNVHFRAWHGDMYSNWFDSPRQYQFDMYNPLCGSVPGCVAPVDNTMRLNLYNNVFNGAVEQDSQNKEIALFNDNVIEASVIISLDAQWNTFIMNYAHNYDHYLLQMGNDTTYVANITPHYANNVLYQVTGFAGTKGVFVLAFGNGGPWTLDGNNNWFGTTINGQTCATLYSASGGTCYLPTQSTGTSSAFANFATASYGPASSGAFGAADTTQTLKGTLSQIAPMTFVTRSSWNDRGAIEFGAGPVVTSCTISPSSATITTGGTQAYTSVITWSDSSTTDGTATLSLSSGTPSVATVSGQTATGVSPGSSTITGTNTVSCGTSALTVNLNQGSLHTPGTIQTKGTVIR